MIYTSGRESFTGLLLSLIVVQRRDHQEIATQRPAWASGMDEQETKELHSFTLRYGDRSYVRTAFAELHFDATRLTLRDSATSWFFHPGKWQRWDRS